MDYVKLTTRDGYQYKEGLNCLNNEKICCSGGLYFSTKW
jgi:hypothetical protein